MRNKHMMITTLLAVGLLSSVSTAQVVIDMPPPAPKATHVKTTTPANSLEPTELRTGDVAIRRYVRSRSGPQYTSGFYNYRRYGYGYGYGYYGFYSPFYFGFGGVHHHHHHNGSKSDSK